MAETQETILLGLDQTRSRIAEFERKFQMSSDDFERRLNSLELDETVKFSHWRMEIGMLRLLERLRDETPSDKDLRGKYRGALSSSDEFSLAKDAEKALDR